MVSGSAAILDDVRAFIQRYVVLSSAQADVLALWVVHTHAFAAAEMTPYLEICSAEKRSGKTRLLEVLELVCARSWLTGRVTTAVLARKVDAEQPTLLLDESDAAFKGDKDYGEALRAVLNSGHRRGGKASVCVGKGTSIGFRDLDVFGPKAIAGIGRLPDTIGDRAIKIQLRRKAPDEHTERFRRREAQACATPVKELLEKWVQTNVDALEHARPKIPEELDDRAGDAWEPLLAIADLVGGTWPERARMAARELSLGERQQDESIGVCLLADIRCVFDQRGCDRIATADLIATLAGDEEAPWGDWRGKGPFGPQGLGRLLKPYGIRSRTIRLLDGSTPKGFHRSQFDDAWKRYLSIALDRSATTPQPAPDKGKDDRQERHDIGLVAGSNPLPIAQCSSDVADVATQLGPLEHLPDPDAEMERLRTKFPELFHDNGAAAMGGAQKR